MISRRGRRAAAVILILLIAAAAASALGTREDPLLEADRLIEEKRYDDAIRFLAEFIKRYPDRLDEAQARLRKINELRRAYNEKAGELLDHMTENPTDQEGKLDRIRELERIEPNPNDQVRGFVEETKATALFTYNNAKREEIMAKGRELIARGSFAEAAALYATGFPLYLPEFDAENRPDAVKAEVHAAVAEVRAVVADFPASRTRLASAAAALAEAARSGDPTGVDVAWTAFEREALAQFRLRAKAADAGWRLRSVFEGFKAADPTLADDSHVSFAYRFTLGTEIERQSEGVVGALDAFWASVFSATDAGFAAGLAALASASDEADAAGKLTEAEAGYARYAELADRALRCLGLWSPYAETDLRGRSTAFARTAFPDVAAGTLELRALRDQSLELAALVRLRSRTGGVDVGLRAFAPKSAPPEDPAHSAALTGFAGFRREAAAVVDAAAAVRARAAALKKRFAAWTDAGFGSAAPVVRQGFLETRTEAVLSSAAATEIATVVGAAAYEYGVHERQYADLEAALASAAPLIDGTQVEAFLAKYPTKAKAVLEPNGRGFRDLGLRLSGFATRYGAEKTYVAASAELVALLAKAADLAAKAAAAAVRNGELAVQADALQRAARKARAEGDARVAESRAALKRYDFAAARERFAQALASYDESLRNEYDPELLAEEDRLVATLQNELKSAENDKVVEDTRRLMDRAKQYMDEENYVEARARYLEARERWGTTHTEDDPNVDLEAQIAYVQTIISARKDRTVPESDPLYPEISQLLSLAKRYYTEGVAFGKAGNAARKKESFDAALKKIQDVKRIFPYNQEARVLELRIAKENDPDKFAQIFRNLMADAKSQLDKGQRDSATRDTYNVLLDLAAIDPRYPSLAAEIYRAEIILGVREPPADPRKIAEARAQVADARRIVESGDRARLSEAEGLLVRARTTLGTIRNDRAARAAYDEAGNLLDVILKRKGATVVYEVPAAARARLNEVIGFFQGRDYLNARKGLNEIFRQYPEAKNNQSFIDMNARLTALGYP